MLTTRRTGDRGPRVVAAQSSLLHEFVHRVVHHALRTVVRDNAFEEDAPAGRDPEDLAPPEEHRGEHPVTVGDGGFQRVRAGAGHDANRAHLARNPHRLAQLERVERGTARVRTPLCEAFLVDLLDRLRKAIYELPESHRKTFPSIPKST